jgi:hypothetical protein
MERDAGVDGPQLERVCDVLVVPSPGHRADEQEWMKYEAVRAPVDLGNGVVIESLEHAMAEEVMDASMARGLNFEATRQFGQLYSFWRDVPESEYEAEPLVWDSSSAISEAIALSRFVLDNGHGLEFVGRILDRSDGHREIVPLLGYDGRLAYRCRNDRFWMTQGEAEELRRLLDTYRAVKDALPDRVHRALWNADRSAHCRFINEAVTNIVAGLEALLNIGDDEPITAQFVKRSQAVANELGIETSRTYWGWVYDARSRAVHGAESRLIAPAGWDETLDDPSADVAKIAKAQDVLRLTIRRALEDEEFRAVFESADSIRVRFPLEDPPGG